MATGKSRSFVILVGGTIVTLVGLTAVMYGLTQWEKQKQLTREIIKPELSTSVALHETTGDMPLVFAYTEFFPKEYLKAELVEQPSDSDVLKKVASGEAQFGVVDIHRVAEDPKLKIVAPISYAYFCGNAFDPTIPEAKTLSALTQWRLTTNLPEDSLYFAYLKTALPGQEIHHIDIRDENQIEWRAVIRQPNGEVFFGMQPYCSQYEKYAFTTRKDDLGVVYDIQEAHESLDLKLPARVLIANAETIEKNGELVARIRSALSAAAESVYRVPTKLESATFYRYQNAVSPEGYSLSMDWEMAYRVARMLTEKKLFPEKDEIDSLEPKAVAAVLKLAGKPVDEAGAQALLPTKEQEEAVELALSKAEEAYTFRYLSPEEVEEKLRLAEAESEEGAAWEEEYVLTGEPKPIERLYKGAINENLYGVHFIDDKNGWIVGSFGTIVKTTDGGKTFAPQNSGVTELLKSVFFLDANNGWIAGVDGIILSTTDGGKTWIRQQTNTVEYIRDVVFVDAQNGFAGARMTSILSTTDGGKTWASRPIREKLDNRLNRLRWVHGNLWAIGEFGAIFVSRDRGQTWEEKNSNTKLTLTDITFLSDRTAVIVGIGGAVLRSDDAGETWSPVDIGSTENFFGLTPVSTTAAMVGGKYTLFRLDLSAPGTVTAAPSKIEGLDLRHSGRWLYTMTRTLDGAMWGVGMIGTTVVSRDSGQNWSVVPVDPTLAAVDPAVAAKS